MNAPRITQQNQNADIRTSEGAAIVKGHYYNLLRDDVATIEPLVDSNTASVSVLEGKLLPVGGQQVSANVVEYNDVVTLTATQIVGTAAGDVGHASGATLVASPGSDYVLEFVSAVMFYDYATAAYTGGGDDTVIQLGTVAQTAAIAGADLLEAAGDKIVMVTPLAAVDLPMTVGTTLNLQGTALTQPGEFEEFTLQLTVAEDTGGTATLSLNGVDHVITLTADTVGNNALEIKAYIDANVTTHTATVLTDTVTITALVGGNQTNATYTATTANSTAGTVTVTQAGVAFAEGVLRVHIKYRTHTTNF